MTLTQHFELSGYDAVCAKRFIRERNVGINGSLQRKVNRGRLQRAEIATAGPCLQ